MYRSEYIVCFRSEISFVPLLFSHRTPFLRPYWQIYFNSTSNHNFTGLRVSDYGVVSYFNSTSNHNLFTSVSRRVSLFLISILHQTTTYPRAVTLLDSLFLISILHQTTTTKLNGRLCRVLFLISILHQTTTIYSRDLDSLELFLISILHQTTTCSDIADAFEGCFLFQFYIKPQPKCPALSLRGSCFLFQFYIKPQPRICDLLIVIRLCGRMNGTNGA